MRLNAIKKISLISLTILSIIGCNGSEKATESAQDGISTTQEVDLGLSVNWAGWNVGASSPEEYGDFFAWGETSPKSADYTPSTYHYYTGIDYINIGSNISGTQYDAAQVNWGGTWRLPTKDECEELKDKCTWSSFTYNGINGMKVTGPNGNSIFLPAAGWSCYGTLYRQGDHGYFWSDYLNENFSNEAWTLGFISYSSEVGLPAKCRAFGFSVRPVKAK